MKNLVIILTLILFPILTNSQEYVDFVSKDGIKIEYKWRKEKLLQKNSPYVLFLRITNTGVEKKLVSFELFYFLNAVTHSRSGFKEYCIKPGQRIKGKRWNLAFKSNIKTLEQINDRSFMWEIEKLNVVNNELCKSGLRLKMEPAHNMYLTK
ncbi:MAG TPA: hypothetical protein DCG75_18450 [Bacteroidales bacterium]|jgi:hypothetical protein|nr:hypothetical protein [Bacteroidales bacterium]